MNKFLLILFLPLQVIAQNNLTKYVDPFIGTGGHGHTYPGPSLPFGMVQLSPDTRLKGWDGCSGYHYSDSLIYGFSHTHLSGTGCSDYGDVLLMPTVGAVQLKNKNYASFFKKSSEQAAPGYYSVFLEKPKVKAELTSTLRTGLHRYTFPSTEAANIILDLTHRDKLHKSEIWITGDNEISGYRISTAWTAKQIVYFVIRFSKPFREFGTANGNNPKEGRRHISGKNLKCYVQFSTKKDETILVKVGISAVSLEGASKNLETEQPGFDFEKVHENAVSAWNQELSRISIESQDETNLRIFYTAMYHAMLAPNLYQDIDGKYLGRDRNIHEAPPGTYYTTFSLWDTYRALHPLFTIIDQKRTVDFINTFLLQYDQAGLLPIWELAAYETFCMVGYHAVPVIADAYLKGIDGFDKDKAMEAMLHSSQLNKHGMKKYKKPGGFIVGLSFFRYVLSLNKYQKHGYFRKGFMNGSVSKTLELAYDDWCIAQMANKMNKPDIYTQYIKRAKNYQNLFDSTTGFMRPRSKNFVRKFDPYKVELNYVEGNAWQYAFSVPHDMSGHMKLLGGKEKLATRLDSLFSTSSKISGMITQDVSGMIGQYAHGNEPSHHIAYTYNYAGQPWKTQYMVRHILKEKYHDKPDGLSGNEDCGQMSAWYIFSSLGFYPLCPGDDHYVMGSPLFEKATIHLENGKTFTITTTNNSSQNVYIQYAKLNGIDHTKSYLEHKEIMNGGTLELIMGNNPNTAWGSSEEDIPVTEILKPITNTFYPGNN